MDFAGDLSGHIQGYITYTIYLTLGAGLLFPWNAFITAADYFELEFPVCASYLFALHSMTDSSMQESHVTCGFAAL